MTATLLLSLAALTGPGQVNPLAPSLPILPKEEEARIEQVIERFIKFESGKLTAKEGAQAAAELKALGPEAIPLLIQGMNHAAIIQSSCPVVIIGRRLSALLATSEDVALLDFARENVGLGVEPGRHRGTIRDLKLGCQLRKAALQRRALAVKAQGGPASPKQMSVTELAAAVTTDRGVDLRPLFTELETRQSEQVVLALAAGALSYEKDTKVLARSLLVRHLSRQSIGLLRSRFKADQAEIRLAAATLAGSRKLPLGEELIELLGDREPEVRDAAHRALVQIAGGKDHGPSRDAGADERAEAVRQWRQWWKSQNP
jgi:hypothetical protein